MRLILQGVLISLGSFGIAQASTAFVVPNANASANGNAGQNLLFGEGFNGSGTYNFQWELAASQLTSMVGEPITAIGFRLVGGDATLAAPNDIGFFSLELSPAVNPIGSLSTTYSNNIGIGGVTVYSAPLDLGTVTGGVGPNPFFLISFSVPYTYTGGDLVMTAAITGETDDLEVDANSIGDGLGDTVSAQNGPPQAEFYSYPITEFQVIPELSTSLTLPGGMFLIGAVGLSKACRR